jgi:2-amino-4-hydroxy-6-hydroxymethyldihydropteridine diphosphokinase
MAKIVLALGGNLGDRQANLHSALQKLQAFVKLHQISSLYETEPVGYADQPWFFNAVCVGETNLTPGDLLVHLKTLERTMGRLGGPRFGPRPVDIDILFYDELVMDTPDLQIPHPRFAQRAFVLQPLAEVLPSFVDPRSGKSASQLLHELNQHEIVRLVDHDWASDIRSAEHA